MGACADHQFRPFVQSKLDTPHLAALAGSKGTGPTPAESHGMNAVERERFHVAGQGGSMGAAAAAAAAAATRTSAKMRHRMASHQLERL